MTAEPATILASQMRLMKSEQTGREYRITIGLPPGYSRSDNEGWPFNDAPARWPVVYVLDANWYFGMVTDMIRPMAWCGNTTDAIVVGIGYAEDHDPIEAVRTSFVQRCVDLTPVRNEDVEKMMEEKHKHPTSTGDAGNFLKFIQSELAPMIEKEYRADPSRRILVGHSYGGLFAVFALFEAPDLFDALVIGSPTLSYGNRVTFQREEAFAREHKKLPAKIFLFVGDLEEDFDNCTVTDTLRLAAILLERKYEGFTLARQVFSDKDHCEVVAPGFQAGLKFALKK